MLTTENDLSLKHTLNTLKIDKLDKMWFIIFNFTLPESMIPTFFFFAKKANEQATKMSKKKKTI